MTAMTTSSALGTSKRSDEYGFQADAVALQTFFRDYEATVGFRSTFSAMLAAAAGVGVGCGSPASWDPYAEIVDRITAGKRVYRALSLLERDDVVVLHRLYGPRNPSSERSEFGDLAPLASLTRAVADARDQLAAREGVTREERTAEAVSASQPEIRAHLEHDFWTEAARVARLEAKHAALVERLDALQARENAGAELGPRSVRQLATGASNLRELELRIRASEDLMGKILEAYLYDGRLRARLGALTAADREITVEDAIRAKLDPPPKACADARAAWKAQRTAFVTEVRLEANRLRKRAHASYRAAQAWSS